MNFRHKEIGFPILKKGVIDGINVFFILLFSFSTQISFSQTKDSTSTYTVKVDSTAKPLNSDTLARKKHKHSPALATVLSTIVPGAGQVYNRKYWKLPIVWGGIGAFGYLFLQQNSKYQKYKKDYASRLNDSTYTSPYYQYANSQVLQLKENTQFNRDLFIIISSIFYVLNIVDANVDGHLFYFDVGEKLTLNLKPTAVPASPLTLPNAGLSLTLRIR